MPRQTSARAAGSSLEPSRPHSSPPEAVPAPEYTISDLARDFGVTLRTLRFYEARGLLSPSRSGLARIYSEQDRARLGLILKGKQLGFTLVEIRAMLAAEEGRGPGQPSASVGGLQLSREQIVEQLELLRAQQQEIAAAIAELETTLATLPEG